MKAVGKEIGINEGRRKDKTSIHEGKIRATNLLY
jgi:hypothetical protein